jgi:transcriptional regulator with XRE-family HTH domain
MLPEEIKTYREMLNLTQDELATRLGVAPALLAEWEAGTRTPESSTMLALALDQLTLTQPIPHELQNVFQKLAESKVELQQMLAAAA